MAMTEKPYVGEFRWQGEPNNSLIEMWNGEEWVLVTFAEQAFELRPVLGRWGRQ
jgi:hypothetical protein